MAIPALKRIKVASERELGARLAEVVEAQTSVMAVSHADKANDAFIDRTRTVEVAASQGWRAGRAYTLNGGLIGTVLIKD